MVRQIFDNMLMKDIPQPNQIWELKEDLIRITSVHSNRYSSSMRGVAWYVCYDYINKDGSIKYKPSYNDSRSNTCCGHMELGRFLHIAKRNK